MDHKAPTFEDEIMHSPHHGAGVSNQSSGPDCCAHAPDATAKNERMRSSDLQVGSLQTPAGSELHVIVIDKMDCPTEEGLIRKRLGKEPGINKLSFNLMDRRLSVTHDAGLLPRVMEALDEIGLGGEIESEAGAAASSHPAVPVSWAKKRALLMIGGVAAAAAEACAYVWGDISPAPMVLSLAAIAMTGLGTYKKGFIALRNLTLNINALMSIAVTGALLIGQWPEAAMVMFLFAVAEAIEENSLQRARRAVESLMSMSPETATVKTSNGWEPVAASSVAVGTVVRARPGERVALDGRVTAGASSVDQSPITGESVPVDKVVGSAVYAGTINQDGELEFETTAVASNSTLARIVRSVHQAQASRAPTQRFVDRFSTWYTPSVFALAVAIAVVPPLVAGGGWVDWIYRALVLLVIACPCALVISTPVTVVSGLAAAARRGMLIKGGVFLENGGKLKVIALDKTGTLTLGKPAVTDVIAFEGTQQALIEAAAALSSRSDHPVSRAVTTYVQGMDVQSVDGFNALRGSGVAGTIAGRRYALGNHRLVEAAGASTPALRDQLDALEASGKTAITLLRDDRAIGIIALADTVRPESAEAVAQLKALGIRAVMLTGDNRHTADAIGKSVGLDDVRSELLPEHKLEAITALQQNGDAVGMVGDGINDAPALARADIGFAMGVAGSDTAIETADVALMDDDPRKLASFVRLSRATKSVLWQNISVALGIKAVFLAFALAGHATLWMAVFADVGASLLVVFNGMRVLRMKF